MSEKRILVVEDESAIRELLRMILHRANYQVIEAASVAAARIQVAESRPDLILLDWMLPGVSGIEYARELQQADDTRTLPFILLTARVEEEDRVRGLNLGADDYISKPFSSNELLARINAVLRRTSPASEAEQLVAGSLRVDTAAQRVTLDGTDLALGPTEYRLLTFLMSHPERVYTREQLLNRVWGHGVYVEERTIDVHIRRLRKALEHSGHDSMIQTVRGSGYRFSTRPI